MTAVGTAIYDSAMRGLVGLVAVVCALIGAGCSTTQGTPTPVPSVAPSVSATDALAGQVKQSMQKKFDTDPDMSQLHLHVTNVVVINSSGNQYKGIATIKTTKGTERDITVNVTADDNNMMWETEPGALLFAVQEADANRTAPQALPPIPQSPVSAVPGADAYGYLGGPRCINQAALIIRTPLSGVVVCNDSPGAYMYEGLRLKDGGRIELPASLSETGFEAINPSDGTRYDVSREGLTIFTRGEVYTEHAVAAGP